MKTANETVVSSYFYRYHGLTKHTVEKLFASGRSLDWKNQPDPFRRYEGAQLVKLPVDFDNNDLAFFDLPAPVAVPNSLQFISSLLYYSFAISAWKQVVDTNHKWALRVNPSSGNLHPTEVHLLSDSVYHYAVNEHLLEKRCSEDLRSEVWSTLGLSEEKLPPLLICLSSIFWREAWKYEQRAFRYCQHDLGHALGALEVSAQLHGWCTLNFSLFDDYKMTDLLGLSQTQEHPLAFIALYPHLQKPDRVVKGGMWHVPRAMSDHPAPYKFTGKGNELSNEQIKYPPIEKVFESTCYNQEQWVEARENFIAFETESMPDLISLMLKAEPEEIDAQSLDVTFPVVTKKKKAQEVIRTRRSAVDMDGQTSASKEVLDAILLSSTKGFSADFQTPKEKGFNLIHLFLYIHRVESVTPGLYYFDRQKEKLVALRLSDQRHFARSASCFQDIASDGIFAVSMVADFNTGVEVFGERCYRLLHYEAGHIGQHFYLTSNALGVDATGIGCFVDDAINQYIELPRGYEVIYNFTFGAALHDPRLTTLPAYDFEK